MSTRQEAQEPLAPCGHPAKYLKYWKGERTIRCMKCNEPTKPLIITEEDAQMDAKPTVREAVERRHCEGCDGQFPHPEDGSDNPEMCPCLGVLTLAPPDKPPFDAVPTAPAQVPQELIGLCPHGNLLCFYCWRDAGFPGGAR
jgi:hypothetical protein